MYPTIASIMNPKPRKAAEPSEPPSTSYEPETIAYMDAVSIPDDSTVYHAGTPQEKTGNELWVVLDDVIKYCKNQGFWTALKFFYPHIGLDGTTRGYNAVDVTKYKKEFAGSWVLSGAGNKGNGANTTASTGYNGDAEHTSTIDMVSAMAVLSHSEGDEMEWSGGSGYYFGSYFRGNIRMMPGGYNSIYQISNPGDSTGIYTTVQEPNIDVKVWRNDVLVLDSAGYAASTKPTHTLTYGARNTGSTIDFFSDKLLGSYAMGIGMRSYSAQLSTAINMLETGLGRK